MTKKLQEDRMTTHFGVFAGRESGGVQILRRIVLLTNNIHFGGSRIPSFVHRHLYNVYVAVMHGDLTGGFA